MPNSKKHFTATPLIAVFLKRRCLLQCFKFLLSSWIIFRFAVSSILKIMLVSGFSFTTVCLRHCRKCVGKKAGRFCRAAGTHRASNPILSGLSTSYYQRSFPVAERKQHRADKHVPAAVGQNAIFE